MHIAAHGCGHDCGDDGNASCHHDGAAQDEEVRDAERDETIGEDDYCQQHFYQKQEMRLPTLFHARCRLKSVMASSETPRYRSKRGQVAKSSWNSTFTHWVWDDPTL